MMDDCEAAYNHFMGECPKISYEIREWMEGYELFRAGWDAAMKKKGEK
jgi:hypothetical protein